MTRNQAVEKFVAGEQVTLCEYRMSRSEHREWRDKVTGKMVAGDFLTHTVETTKGPVIVGERVEESKTHAQRLDEMSKAGVKKGCTVLLFFRSLAEDKGVVKASGHLEFVEPAK